MENQNKKTASNLALVKAFRKNFTPMQATISVLKEEIASIQTHINKTPLLDELERIDKLISLKKEELLKKIELLTIEDLQQD